MGLESKSVVNRSAAVCLPVDSVTVIGPLRAKSTDIFTIVIARTEAHGIYLCVRRHSIILSNRTKKYSLFKTVSTVRALRSVLSFKTWIMGKGGGGEIM